MQIQFSIIYANTYSLSSQIKQQSQINVVHINEAA